MGATPAFKLVSKPVELTVIRPVELAVKVKRPLVVNEPVALSDLLDIALVNTTGEARKVTPPTKSGTTRFWVQVRGMPAEVKLTRQPKNSEVVELAAGGRLSLLGEKGIAPRPFLPQLRLGLHRSIPTHATQIPEHPINVGVCVQ